MASSTSSGSGNIENGPGNGKFIVVVGPTAAGKTSLVDMLVGAGYGRRQITCTTRAMRPGEEDGKDYHFLTREAFMKQQQDGMFLEFAEVHGNLYGTPKAPIIKSLAAGQDVICAIDIQGLRQIKGCPEELIRYGLFSVFLYASLRTVERRLKARALAQGKSISVAELETRLATAERELKCITECHAVVVNELDGGPHIAKAFTSLRQAIDLRGRLVGFRKRPRPWDQVAWKRRDSVRA